MFYSRGRPPALTSLKRLYEMKPSGEMGTGAVSHTNVCFNRSVMDVYTYKEDFLSFMTNKSSRIQQIVFFVNSN